MIRCPKCKTLGITISAPIYHAVYLDRDENVTGYERSGDIEYDTSVDATCPECEWDGQLTDAYTDANQPDNNTEE